MHGFIGDVHGDLEALEWALETLRDCDSVWCLGDVVDGSRDRECIALLQRSRVQVLRGNHDHWAVRQTLFVRHSAAELQWLANLPLEHEADGWLACHSHYEVEGNNIHWIYLDGDLNARLAFEHWAQRVILCGHTHIPAVHTLVGDDVTYRGTASLRGDSPRVALEAERRYIINVGRPTLCVVALDETAAEFRFRQQAQAVPRVSWWGKIRSHFVAPPPSGEAPPWERYVRTLLYNAAFIRDPLAELDWLLQKTVGEGEADGYILSFREALASGRPLAPVVAVWNHTEQVAHDLVAAAERRLSESHQL